MSAVTEKKPRLTTSAMIASIASEGQRVKAAPFGKALVEYASARQEVVGLTADLAKYTDLHLFAQAYPDRFFQMGMAEQLLMAAAGGLAKEGLVPFATTYAVFGTRRAYDFIHQVIAEADGGPREVTLLATGSEVALALAARDALQAGGTPTAVVSMPSWELFAAQDAAYRSSVLGRDTVRVGCEAALRFGWDRWLGERGGFVGMTGFEASGPAEVLYPHFGITPEAIVAEARRLLATQPETATA